VTAPATVIAKRCARCKLKKPVDQFYRDQRRRDALTLYCKDCVADRERQRPPRTVTANRLIRRFAYRRAERDLRRMHPDDFQAFYASHIAEGFELADRLSDDELLDTLARLDERDDPGRQRASA
jgi:threonine synthase